MGTLTEAIKTVFNAVTFDLHTCVPGKIEKYEYKYQRAEIKPLIKIQYYDNTVTSVPVIANVPVIFPRTSRVIFHFPLNKGDTGLTLFTERALEKWLSLGDEVGPGDVRKFDLSDAVFIPGLYPFSETSPADNNDDVILQYNNTGLRIKGNGEIEIGGNNFKKLINEEFQSMFNTHVHNFMGFVGTGTPTPGVTTGPCDFAGANPPPVPPSPGFTYPGIAITDNELTKKVTME